MKQSDEMKVAKKIADLVADLRLDLELVGFYLATYASIKIVKRLTKISKTAKRSKDEANQLPK
jgi:hypothetical protein